MSRSYKKNPVVTDHSANTKTMKRIANRTVRRSLKDEEDMPARLQHKKMTERCEIRDYRERMTRAEAIDWYNDKSQYKTAYFKKRYPTLEAWLKYWEKCYVRK